MKYTKEKLLEIYEKECLQNKLRYSEVRKKYNIPRGTWDYWIRQKYNKVADKRLYKANDDFFDSIDSEIKAYLLGYLYADGYLANDGRMGIRLKIDDCEIIKMIQHYICPNNPIEYSNNQNFKRRPQCSIRWKSKQMYNRLKELGFCIDKTHTESNIFQYIPEDMKFHFIRGFFDGDGHISNYHLDNSTKRKISLCFCNGTVKILNDIKEYLKNYRTKIYNYNTYFTLQCDHQIDTYYILRKLYDNSNFYLTRKKNQAITIFEYYYTHYQIYKILYIHFFYWKHMKLKSI